MSDARRAFAAPDGRTWGVEVRTPGFSNVMIVFVYPDARTSRLDRYAWYNWHGPESHMVTSQVDPEHALRALSDGQLRELFLRSMPITPRWNPLGQQARINL